MARKSKINKILKEKEMKRFKKLSPQQRIDIAISHNNLIRLIFGSGLKSMGFTKKQINLIWKRQNA